MSITCDLAVELMAEGSSCQVFPVHVFRWVCMAGHSKALIKIGQFLCVCFQIDVDGNTMEDTPKDNSQRHKRT